MNTARNIFNKFWNKTFSKIWPINLGSGQEDVQSQPTGSKVTFQKETTLINSLDVKPNDRHVPDQIEFECPPVGNISSTNDTEIQEHIMFRKTNLSKGHAVYQ
ncbi:hypothetical protein BDK51DRAFT_32479 [Blyttiomyces helicus]|uniref:Uncharacterized protein n=1 Tax=Blyttiomyces helicus TaxID=388810 RepID=A0A4P9WK12_9FUNG|nr:hypothetical protein BDK51DRAFT_32479 [Blyttiomyces helicus]|eukprot:RKO93291.1 hypothetical protein BDK51DRAFT_32479 [Blyttiomyces helicus]